MSSSAPTKIRRLLIGTTASAGPRTATTIDSAPSAAAAPMIADRQPRVTPTAKTMVSASTISTRQATKAAAKRNTSWVIAPDQPACSIYYCADQS